MDEEGLKSIRSRQLTDRGVDYRKEMKLKAVKTLYRKCESAHSDISSLIQDGAASGKVRTEYTKYMSLLEEFYDARDIYLSLLVDEEMKGYEDEMKRQNEKLDQFKETVETHLLKTPEKRVNPKDDIGPNDSISHTSSRSALSLARCREEQKKAELLAKSAALEQFQKLEMDKLRLRMEEEKLKLKTEVDIAEARTKVIDKYERASMSQEAMPSELPGEDNVPNSPVRPEKDPLFTLSRFNPEAEVFRPVDNLSAYRLLKKPTMELSKFSGNPLDYKKFLRQFKSRIVAVADDYEEIVNYLDQYTIGEAKKIVAGYSYLDGEAAYNAIMREFEERYGDPSIIACAFIKKALDWPALKADNAQGLDEYALFLTEAMCAVEGMDALRVLEYPDNLKRLVVKLPFFYHERWRNVVQSAKDKAKPVDFNLLVDFVRREAKKAMDPIFGKKAPGSERKGVP